MATEIGQFDVAEKYPAVMKGYNEILKMPEYASVHKTMMDFLAAMAAKR